MENKNNILWAIGTVILTLALVAAFHIGSIVKTFGTITSPATQLDYLNLTQALGFGPNAQTQGSLSTNIMGGRAIAVNAPIICSIPNPFNATSTLINASLNTTNTETSNGGIIFSVASTATASTTLIGQASLIAANTFATLQSGGVASTTDQGVAIGPGQSLNIGTSLGSPATGYTGQCNALFESAN